MTRVVRERIASSLQTCTTVTLDRADADELWDILQVSIEELEATDLGRSLRPLSREVVDRLRELQKALLGQSPDKDDQQG